MVGVVTAGLVGSPASADVVSLTGTVTDLATGEPVPDACVSA
jgi:protocatechuate 3,4-dioxygenase beta subunit